MVGGCSVVYCVCVQRGTRVCILYESPTSLPGCCVVVKYCVVNCMHLRLMLHLQCPQGCSWRQVYVKFGDRAEPPRKAA